MDTVDSDEIRARSVWRFVARLIKERRKRRKDGTGGRCNPFPPQIVHVLFKDLYVIVGNWALSLV